MRVLVTRPEPGCSATSRLLALRGFEPVALPLFQTVFAPLPPQALSGPTAAVVLTSANGLRGIDPSAWREAQVSKAPIYCVGTATADTARSCGFADVRTGPGDAAGLAALITLDWRSGRLEVTPDLPLRYLAGVPRLPDLESLLAEQKLAFEVVDVYRMTEISYSTDFILEHIFMRPVPAILLHSANAARRLATLLLAETLSKQVDRSRFHCLSAAIVAALPVDWRPRSIAARSPEDASLLASLDTFS